MRGGSRERSQHGGEEQNLRGAPQGALDRNRKREERRVEERPRQRIGSVQASLVGIGPVDQPLGEDPVAEEDPAVLDGRADDEEDREQQQEADDDAAASLGIQGFPPGGQRMLRGG